MWTFDRFKFHVLISTAIKTPCQITQPALARLQQELNITEAHTTHNLFRGPSGAEIEYLPIDGAIPMAFMNFTQWEELHDHLNIGNFHHPLHQKNASKAASLLQASAIFRMPNPCEGAPTWLHVAFSFRHRQPMITKSASQMLRYSSWDHLNPRNLEFFEDWTIGRPDMIVPPQMWRKMCGIGLQE